MTSFKMVTVIVPTLHRSDLITRCLEHLGRQSLDPTQFEVIIVDNEAWSGPSLASDVGETFGANVRVISLEKNLGTTGSINRAMEQSNSKYVLLLNNDVELHSDFLATSVSFLENNCTFGFVTGKLLSASQRDQLDGAGDALLLGGGAYRIGCGDLDRGQFEKPHGVLSGCGAATLYCRSAIHDAGGLDEDLFAYFDDLDLALRVRLLGYDGYYLPSAIAYHLGSATLGNVRHPKIWEWLTRNQLLVLVKTFPRNILLRVLPRIFLFQCLWFLLAIRRAAFLAYLRGAVSLIRMMPMTLRKRKTIQRTRRVDDRTFFETLRESEKQIYAWQRGRLESSRSKLLTLYFTLFGPP